MAVSTYSVSGAKATTAIKLPKDIFAVEVTNYELLKQAYVAHQANGRLNLAKTLKRGEVSGGGKKPWRQKGTGRARTGSIRNPIWRGGGITFGPSGNENYSKKINASSKRVALKQALSLATSNKPVFVIDDFVVKTGKTKDSVKLLSKIGVTGQATVVVTNPSIETVKALNNLQDVNLVMANKLSVVDVLDARNLVFSKDAIESLTVRLGGAK